MSINRWPPIPRFYGHIDTVGISFGGGGWIKMKGELQLRWDTWRKKLCLFYVSEYSSPFKTSKQKNLHFRLKFTDRRLAPIPHFTDMSIKSRIFYALSKFPILRF